MKLMVVGIDGGDLDLIRKYIDDLPNFKKVMDEGCYGYLKSTTPPLTPQAFTSFMTGKSPENHGVQSFWKEKGVPVFKTLGDSFVNSTWIKGKTFFEVLSDNGISVGIINIPVTYPAKRFKIDGYLVSGVFLPGHNCIYTNPPELKYDIESKFGYMIDIQYTGWVVPTEEELAGPINEMMVFNMLKTITKIRFETLQYLMGNYPTDFITFVEGSSDRLQHFFWGDEEKLREWWILMDEILGHILKLADNVLIFSDHGFCSCDDDTQTYEYLKGVVTLGKRPKHMRGHHRMLGLVMAYGKDIKKGVIEGEIIDVAPTILDFMGIKVPKDMDGKVLAIRNV